MKILVEVEVNCANGVYDVKFHNLTDSNQPIDLEGATRMVKKVMDNVLEEHYKKANKEDFVVNTKKELN